MRYWFIGGMALAALYLGLPTMARAENIQWQLELLRAEIASQFNGERLQRKQDQQFDEMMRSMQTPRLPPLPPLPRNAFIDELISSIPQNPDPRPAASPYLGSEEVMRGPAALIRR